MTMKMVTDQNFKSHIVQQGVTVVDVGASWCPPCRTLLPILDELGQEFGEKVAILKVDADESPDTAADLHVMSMPTVIFFKNGEPVDKLVGLRDKAVYKSLILKYLS